MISRNTTKGSGIFYKRQSSEQLRIGGKMKNDAAMALEAKNTIKAVEDANGLQRLVAYYQRLFERDENVNHYSPEDYQNAKRKFVKYLLDSRVML